VFNNNTQKKKQIEDLLAENNSRMAILKQKRDKIVSSFLETLKENKLAEINEHMKQL
jgi:hypothetical protein